MPAFLRVIWTDDPDSYPEATYINIESLQKDTISIVIMQENAGFDVVAHNNQSASGCVLAHFTDAIKAMSFCEMLLNVLGFDVIDIENLKKDACKEGEYLDLSNP